MLRGCVVWVLLTGCSFVGIHRSPAHPSDVACERLRWLPVMDSLAAGAAGATSAIVYNDQSRSSPLPISMLVATVWAAASATYGYVETTHCRDPEWAHGTP